MPGATQFVAGGTPSTHARPPGPPGAAGRPGGGGGGLSSDTATPRRTSGQKHSRYQRAPGKVRVLCTVEGETATLLLGDRPPPCIRVSLRCTRTSTGLGMGDISQEKMRDALVRALNVLSTHEFLASNVVVRARHTSLGTSMYYGMGVHCTEAINRLPLG